MIDTKFLYEKKYVAEQHPYMLALVICIGVWAFSLCDQSLFSGTAVAVTAFLAAVRLFRKFMAVKKPQYVRFVFSLLVTFAAAILFFMLEFKGGFFLLAGIICLLGMYLKYKKDMMAPEHLRLIVISFSFLLYVSYVLYTTCTSRQIDAGYLHGGTGHLAYIEYLYEHWFVLPEFDPRTVTQMYHPPLYYWIAAAVVRLTTFLGVSYEQALESAQVISLYSGICTLITADKIFRCFHLKGYALTASLAVTAFAVPLVMLSDVLNNDMLSIALETGAIYCVLQWYEEKSFANIIKTALCIGLGMMTKLSVVLAAPPIALIFFYVFFAERKNWKKYSMQFAVFLGICVPLALWFPVKNLLLFGVPFGYVPAGNYSEYMESIPVWQRLFDFGWQNFQYPITVNYGGTVFDSRALFEDYNPVIALIKSTVDMHMLRYASPLATVFYIRFYLTLILGVTGFVYMVYVLFAETVREERIKHLSIVVFYVVTMTSYYIFCIKNQNMHAQHIRYVFDIIIVGSLYIGLLLQRTSKHSLMQLFRKILVVLVCVYAAMTVIMFAVLSFEK